MDDPAPEPETSGASAAAGITASRPLWASEGWWAGTRREDELGAWLTLLGLAEVEPAMRGICGQDVSLTQLASDTLRRHGKEATTAWLQQHGFAAHTTTTLAYVQQDSQGLTNLKTMYVEDLHAAEEDKAGTDLAELLNELQLSNESAASFRDALQRAAAWPDLPGLDALLLAAMPDERPSMIQEGELQQALKDLREHSAVDFALYSTVLPKWPRWRPRRRVTLCIGNDSCTRPLL
jgi:hypothetical protein